MVDDPGIEVVEHALVVDLLTAADGAVCGVTLHVIGEGQVDGVGAAYGRAVVLATGGLGQIYTSTTNPPVATGDGMAAALRAGAGVTDLEFVQFHPTVLYLGEGSTGQQPLISEALRGEGAFLVDDDGARFMPGRHELADLAPRDVVARAILDVMSDSGARARLARRPPPRRGRSSRRGSRRSSPAVASWASTRSTELLPVAPAQHYASGGVETDLVGRSSVDGLYACGECSCTGVHGANRLASNSLLEGLVFAHRIADDVTARIAARAAPAPRAGCGCRWRRRCSTRHTASTLQRAMTRGAGPVRSAKSTDEALEHLARLAALAPSQAEPGPPTWETTNLLHLGQALSLVAHLREETRGGHVRSDFPDRDDTRWLTHLTTTPGRGRWARRDGATRGLPSRPAPGSAHDRPRVPVGRRPPARRAGPGRGPRRWHRRHDPRHHPGEPAVGRRTWWHAPTVSWQGCPSSPSSSEAVDARLGTRCGRGSTCTSDDGTRVVRGDHLGTLRGSTRTTLIAERTALNVLSRTSGVATHTRRWADELRGSGATVLDTRKTTPGMRALEKYAVRCGGGTNKRMGLYDVAMVKDNHKIAAGGLTAAYEAVRQTFPRRPRPGRGHDDGGGTGVRGGRGQVPPVRQHVDRPAPQRPWRPCGRRARPSRWRPPAASRLEVAAAYAATGVDYLSVGGLTHSSPILDIALDLDPEGGRQPTKMQKG